jgi:hypothetical protein
MSAGQHMSQLQRLHEGAKAQAETIADLSDNGLSRGARDQHTIYAGLDEAIVLSIDARELADVLRTVGQMLRHMSLHEVRSALLFLEAQHGRAPSEPPPHDEGREPYHGASGLLDEITRREKPPWKEDE